MALSVVTSLARLPRLAAVPSEAWLHFGALELATGVTFRGRGVRLGRWEGGWRLRLMSFCGSKVIRFDAIPIEER